MFKISRITLPWIIFGYVLLAGCSSRETAEGDIIGIWVEKEITDASSQAVDCAVFELREDGTFRADNFPREYFIAKSTPSLPRVQASGKWKIEKIKDTQFIDLFIDPNPELFYSGGHHSTLYISGDGSSLTLYAWAHDENERIYFVKRDTADCSD